MKWILFFIALTPSLGAAMTPEEGLSRLKAGNQRFVEELQKHPNRRTTDKRLALTEAQSPFAVVVSCSDSRVIPEIIFDESLGDLFVIRVAGNVVGATGLESVEYAVGHLNPVVVLVLGHENCGAVNAVVHGKTKGIPAIAALIEPSVKKEQSQQSSVPLLKRSIQQNAIQMRAALLQSPIIQQAYQDKSVTLQAGYYNMQTGFVEFLESEKESS